MLLRDALGETLRDARTRQNRTLRDVSTAANVSLGYLSEVERGRKEASSELLASICDALDVELSDVLSTVSAAIRTEVGAGKVGVTTNSGKAHVPAGVAFDKTFGDKTFGDKAFGDKSTAGSRHQHPVRATTRPAGARPAGPGRSQLRIVVPFERPEAPVH